MAATYSSDFRLFGLDLSRWPAQWRAAGQLLLALPGIRALSPTLTVRRTGADGHTTAWQLHGGVATPLAAAQASAALAAPQVQVADISRDDVLERQLILPRLSPADLAHAVQLEVSACSPFSVDETVHGFAATPLADTTRVDLAITSRSQCQAALARAGLDSTAEIWLAPAPAQAHAAHAPLVLIGWGEAARAHRARRSQTRLLGGCLLVLALLAALALTPVAFKRMQARQAEQALAALQRQAAPQLAQREAILQRAQQLQAVGELAAQQLALPPVLDMLTRAVPDGAWLTSLRVEGNKLVLNGQADDAAALVQQLARQPGVTEARLSSPATRGINDQKERFVIELHASAAHYGPIRAASAPGATP
ncbi:MAG: PilN domain-containing protein [Pseudomonadota bacterium]|nr:PilN domain-containing protein [Pseudomonadota bacterium]